MTNNSARSIFDSLVTIYDDDITVGTATTLAKELGLDFDVREYDF